MPKRQLLITILAAVLVIGGLAVYQLTLPPVMHGGVIDPPKPMPDFTLQSANGPVRLSDFRGKVILMFFGYTSCPDICPLTLANFREALNNLGENASQVQVVYVSVDWKRDTPEKVSSYAAAFRPDFVGLTGTQDEIDAVTRDYMIHYQINEPDENGFYTVDHTATALVLDRDGNLIMTWPYGLTPSDLLDDLKVLIRR